MDIWYKTYLKQKTNWSIFNTIEHTSAQTWNLSQASQAFLCKKFWAWVKFYNEHTLFWL